MVGLLGSMGVTLVFLTMWANAGNRIVRQQQKIKYPLEIAVIIDDSDSVNDTNFWHMRDVARQIPNYFVMSDQDVRIGIMKFEDHAKVVERLTADEKVIRNFDTQRIRGGTNTHRALDMVKDDMFRDVRPEAMKVVILITDGASYKPEQAAQKLRDDGVLIFAAFIGNDLKAIDHLNVLAGDRSRVYPLDSFADLTAELFKIIGAAIQKQIQCKFEEACRFNDTSYQHCMHDWYRPKVGNETCTNRPPPPSQISLSCQNADDCHEMCDKLWPWGKWPCPSNDTGQIMQWNRGGPMPMEHKAVLDWCPKTIDVRCAEPPSTTTKNTRTPLGAEDENGEGKGGKWGIGGFPWWAIGVIIGALLLIAIIVILIRRAKIKKPTGVAMGKKGQQKISKSAPSTKSTVSQSTLTAKSIDGKSAALWHNMGKRGMDESVQVSLHESTVMKPWGRKAAKSIGGKSVALWHNMGKRGMDESVQVSLHESTATRPRRRKAGTQSKSAGTSSMVAKKSVGKSISVSTTMERKKGGKL